MPDQDRLYVRTAEFARVAERIEHVTTLTSRLNVLPFDDKAARAALLSEIVGKPVPDSVTVYPPFYTDHGLGIDFGAVVTKDIPPNTLVTGSAAFARKRWND
ncbi:hypothetical protein [Streptomyces sp. Inha503]|uniref:hypothetical protein n=1 Tax=Streptomyces sp. Inha503 TaxID=3383314 RepID=UPI0039A0213C